MTKIKDLLHRRTDLSTFLVHLTRDCGDATARENLLSIAKDNLIEARSAFGPAAWLEEHLTGTAVTQKAVCFTETPLEHTWMMLEDIEGRSVHFQPFGLAVTKTTARKDHVNPVWYSDISARGRDWPATAINSIVTEAVGRARRPDGQIDPQALRAEPILQVTPFFEQMGPQKNGLPKEFWWEREWRRVGDYPIAFPDRLVAVFAPAEEHDCFRKELTERNALWGKRPILDPRWGVERMVAQLANIADEHVGPFPIV